MAAYKEIIRVSKLFITNTICDSFVLSAVYTDIFDVISIIFLNW